MQHSTHNRRLIQIEAPPVTKHIARTLERYPDGGQILKVIINSNNNVHQTLIRSHLL